MINLIAVGIITVYTVIIGTVVLITRSKTDDFMEKRKREILAKIKERIKTSVEREAYAKQQLREELMQKAEIGDLEGIKMLLNMMG
tara:strand:+ start:168 stop:425 length:258 start_codon:yes stop_codon:yes gene_type:complete